MRAWRERRWPAPEAPVPSHVCLCASARSRAFLHVSLFAVAPRVRLVPSQRKRMDAWAVVCDAVPLLVSRQSDMRWPVCLSSCVNSCALLSHSYTSFTNRLHQQRRAFYCLRNVCYINREERVCRPSRSISARRSALRSASWSFSALARVP